MKREWRKTGSGQPVELRSEEVQELTRLLRAGDPEPFVRRQEITLAVVETMEHARRQAGLIFPGDPEWPEEGGRGRVR